MGEEIGCCTRHPSVHRVHLCAWCVSKTTSITGLGAGPPAKLGVVDWRSGSPTEPESPLRWEMLEAVSRAQKRRGYPCRTALDKYQNTTRDICMHPIHVVRTGRFGGSPRADSYFKGVNSPPGSPQIYRPWILTCVTFYNMHRVWCFSNMRHLSVQWKDGESCLLFFFLCVGRNQLSDAEPLPRAFDKAAPLASCFVGTTCSTSYMKLRGSTSCSDIAAGSTNQDPRNLPRGFRLQLTSQATSSRRVFLFSRA